MRTWCQMASLYYREWQLNKKLKELEYWAEHLSSSFSMDRKIVWPSTKILPLSCIGSYSSELFSNDYNLASWTNIIRMRRSHSVKDVSPLRPLSMSAMLPGVLLLMSFGLINTILLYHFVQFKKREWQKYKVSYWRYSSDK